MCQNNRSQYVPANWPVDGSKNLEQIEKANKHFQSTKVTTSGFSEGCFKARLTAQFVQKCWL